MKDLIPVLILDNMRDTVAHHKLTGNSTRKMSSAVIRAKISSLCLPEIKVDFAMRTLSKATSPVRFLQLL